ncbi:nitrile hydratase subunit beta [Bradyrhizobium sp. AS23.2]|uniref:nitrile hydratase subunit beta n=1 Tax=Bradyrhizobium sp. AS23.2 TaxID=1680155 RepID=UPI001161253F|nr:nitrile hydratase subunit beta [Bradyrhizobium sp. AS23.2]
MRLRYERWIVAFGNILFQKQILTPEELALKMEDVKARFAANDSNEPKQANRA